MDVLLRRNWLWILCCVSLVTWLATSCSCDQTPPVKEGTVNTDAGGGGDSVAEQHPTDEAKPCVSRCDCPQGQECSDGSCFVPTKPVYCCDRENCPQGQACQDNGGKGGVCGLRPQCKQTCDCDQGLACVDGFCTKTDTPVYCCEKSGCSPGASCESLRGGTGVCGSEGSVCVSACDCVGGLGCVNGQCTKASTPMYCCGAKDCPQGASCETRSGGKGVCGQTQSCKTSCDCATGEACANGTCTKTDIPVYCCDTPESCPSGQVCDTRDGQRQKCPSQQQCQQHCDCAQGQFCNNGTCVTGGTQVYCCSKPGCPPKAACFNADGSVGNCAGQKCGSDAACGKPTCVQQGDQCTQTVPRCRDDGVCANELTSNRGVCDPASGACKFAPPECKAACDCPQGQGCVQGRCEKGFAPVYCCAKDGCPAKQKCVERDGSAGTCPAQPQCRSSADCGQRSCKQSGDNCVYVIPSCNVATGACTQVAQTLANADCKVSPSGARTCVPRKPPQCKTDNDCPVDSCSQSGTSCVMSSHACVNGSCVPAPGRVMPNAECRQDPNGRPQCVPKPPQCRTDSDCGKNSCSQSGTTCVQVKSACSNGQCFTARGAVPNAKCDPRQGVCVPTPVQCKTPCDCSQGQDCVNNQCTSSGSPVYCCSKAGCPANAVCINTNGTKGQCPSSVCRTNSDCGRASCSQSGMSCVQKVPRCVNGACTASTVTSSGFCNPSSGACTSVQFCKTTCDCPQGQACRQSSPLPIPGQQGVCVPSNPREYCCDKAGCPSGRVCTTKSGSQSTCPTVCKTPCDCSPGEDCVSNRCVTGTKPVYCCDDKQKCPPGAACRDKNNQSGTCPNTPRTCKTNCDCIQGEACANGTCAKSSTPVYCCDAAGCPAGKACTDKNGLKGVCPQACKETCDCPQGQRCLRGVCTASSGSVYCCDKAGCPSNNFCFKKGGGTGRCPVQKCSSPCDCNQGEDCRNGQCTRVFPSVYCCSKSGCPSGQACKDSSNKWGTCSGAPACKSPCDCPQGRDCYRGQCIQVSPAVYCCENVGCPAGQTCYDSSNKQAVCPGVQCTTSCDCPRQGRACVRGRCVYSNPRIYCCSKSGCPAGNACEDKNGKLNVCPGNTCKTACDCNQGEDCRNGNCVRVSPPVYCCSKSGCRSGQTCQKADGTHSTCAVQCRTRCDCNQGEDCFRGNCFPRPGAYCCDKSGCPQGQSCINRSGQSGVCGGSSGGTCKVRCDCPQGQECVNGRCTTAPFPVYCCDKAGCPSRFSCQDKSGKSGFCAP